MEHPLPEIKDIGQHVGFTHQPQGIGLASAARFFAELACILKRISQAALHLETIVNHALYGRLMGCAFHGNAADTGINAAGVFPDNHIIDLLGRLVFKGRLHSRIKAYRSQVYELIQFEAQPQ